MKQFKVIVKNKAGELAKVCEALAEKSVDIRAISTEAISETEGYIKVIPDDDVNAKLALDAGGFGFETSDVLVVDVLDQPGNVSKITRRIADTGINIQSFYLLDKGLFAMVVSRNDIANAKEALEDRVVESE